MTNIILGSAFLVSLVMLPSFATVIIAVVYLSQGGNLFLVILGGFVLDELFGAPIAALHGFSYLYTTLALVLSLSTLYFRRALFE
ncbi:MAG: hypothetical protein Q7R74_01475 [bacterium]|nr:hypothetical protein [bacterium]